MEKSLPTVQQSKQVCDRFFLLAAGRVWHSICLRCSHCHCELQTHPSLYWRDGNIYCQQDYSRIFGGGQCARCLQPIPPTDLVMRSGDLTFHPHCFSCQVITSKYMLLFFFLKTCIFQECDLKYTLLNPPPENIQ
uniref:LIM/homeobox protein Lhx9-like n=1 Tax=Fundulus heteroclitus TaxID=8078 RepID=A0A3Q2QRY6_FUNHE